MIKTIIKFSVISIALTWLSPVWAAVPDLIPVQGFLTDKAAGEPIDGPTDMRFGIYDAKTGGALLWESVYDSSTEQVNVDQGYFTVYLGELPSSPLNFMPLIHESQLWLQLTVDGEAMERIRMASVAFSEEAQFCKQVGDLEAAEIQPFLGPPCEDGHYLRGWDADAGAPICEPDQIAAQSGTGYFNVSGCDVIFEHSNDQSVLISNYCEVSKTATSSHTNVFIPVHLPDGVTVITVRTWVRDNNATTNANVYVRMYRRSVAEGVYSGGTNPKADMMSSSVTNTGSESAEIQMMEDTGIDYAVINNMTYDYYFWITLGNTATQFADMSFFKARIEYSFD